MDIAVGTDDDIARSAAGNRASACTRDLATLAATDGNSAVRPTISPVTAAAGVCIPTGTSERPILAAGIDRASAGSLINVPFAGAALSRTGRRSVDSATKRTVHGSSITAVWALRGRIRPRHGACFMPAASEVAPAEVAVAAAELAITAATTELAAAATQLPATTTATEVASTASAELTAATAKAAASAAEIVGATSAASAAETATSSSAGCAASAATAEPSAAAGFHSHQKHRGKHSRSRQSLYRYFHGSFPF
jgi:hypothetical protein